MAERQWSIGYDQKAAPREKRWGKTRKAGFERMQRNCIVRSNGRHSLGPTLLCPSSFYSAPRRQKKQAVWSIRCRTRYSRVAFAGNSCPSPPMSFGAERQRKQAKGAAYSYLVQYFMRPSITTDSHRVHMVSHSGSLLQPTNCTPVAPRIRPCSTCILVAREAKQKSPASSRVCRPPKSHKRVRDIAEKWDTAFIAPS
jgi:hypothetical protein